MVTLQKNSEHEFKALRLKVSELQKQLEEVKRDLAATQSILATKDKELEALLKNLKELEELRELKEVAMFYKIFIFLAMTFLFLDHAIFSAYVFVSKY